MLPRSQIPLGPDRHALGNSAPAATSAFLAGDAFDDSLFQRWLSQLIADHYAQLAQSADPARRAFQIGQSWRGLLKTFGKPSDVQFAEFFVRLVEFIKRHDPLAARLRRAVSLLRLEHNRTGLFLGPHTLPVICFNRKLSLSLLRSTAIRLCDWLDAILQLHAFAHCHARPGCFGAHPQKPSPACVDLYVCRSPFSNGCSKAHIVNRDTASNSWPTFLLDLTIIRLWPLVKNYHWTATQLLDVLRRVLPPQQLAPCRNRTQLVAYCSKNLSLRHPGVKGNRRWFVDPQPPALDLALCLCAPENADLRAGESYL